MADDAQTFAAAKAYTDREHAEHLNALDPHQYAEMVYGGGSQINGHIVNLTVGQTFPAVVPGSVLFAPGPTPARGVYMPNEAGNAWVRLGDGPLPIDTTAPTVPGSFRLVGTPTTTSISTAWNASTDAETGVAAYEVSVDGGAFVPLSGATLAYTFINLTPSTNHSMQVRARDAAATPNTSSAAVLSAATAAVAVTSPQNLRTTTIATTSITFAWDAPASGTVARYEWRLGTGTFATNAFATSRQVTGLTQSTFYTFGVRAVFTTGATSAEVTLTVRTSATNPNPVLTLTGVSHSAGSDHGGFGDNWPAWRVYNSSTLTQSAARNPQPKIIAWSNGGTPLQGTYASILASCRTTLDNFYYNGTGNTPSVRAPIKLYWSNGNENYNVTDISNPAQYVESMRALYDAVHTVSATTGQRRYPNAYAGSNPTTYQEQSGTVQSNLHATARYHDFVMWSMYPLNLGNDGQFTGPYNWPSLNESDRTNAALGYLVRTFYRTKQAEAVARTALGNPTFRLQITAGELGVTNHNTDTTVRPYWATHACWAGAMKLAVQYDLDMPFLLWWDGGSGAYGETVVSGRASGFIDEPSSTDPSTAQVWHDPHLYNHEFGGTHPASWTGNPKPGWNTTGPVV